MSKAAHPWNRAAGARGIGANTAIFRVVDAVLSIACANVTNRGRYQDLTDM
jgi:hypothetical protein